MTADYSERESSAPRERPPARQRPDPPMYPGGMMIDHEEEQAVLEVLRSKRLFRYYGPQPGPSKVEELERAFAEHMGTRYALAVSSGTAALVCALQGIGIGPGDEVIVPAYTWIASAAAVLAVGGVPVLAEIDESLTLDPDDVERRITPDTKAIMAVHMRGAPCDMDGLSAVSQRHGLRLVEDTAQADGASHRGRRLGSIGDVGCFSLQFNKIITAGEGGMVISNSEEIWKRATMYHDVIGGLRNRFPSDEILWGINFRMPELLAAVMLVQLGRLEGLLADMRERKGKLRASIEDVARQRGITFRAVADPDGDAAVALMFFAPDAVVAGKIAQALRAENIGASVVYDPDRVDYHIYTHWEPIVHHRTWTESGGPWRWARRDISYEPDVCGRSLELLARTVQLDISPLLTDRDIEETADGIHRVLNAPPSSL